MIPLVVKEKKNFTVVPVAIILLFTYICLTVILCTVTGKRLGVVIRLLTWDSSEKPGYASDTFCSHG